MLLKTRRQLLHSQMIASVISQLTRFKDDDGKALNAKHQCGYCKERGYFYCATCFPPGTTPTHAICSPNTERPCFAKHVLGEPCKHTMHIAGARKWPAAGPAAFCTENSQILHSQCKKRN